MKWQTLNVTHDEEFGCTGFLVEGMSRGMNAAMEGRLVAHDILEHQNGVSSIGSVEDELQAFGAVWYIRGQHGYLGQSSMFSPEDTLASDITCMFENFEVDGWLDRCDYKEVEDEIFEYIVAKGIEDADSYYEHDESETERFRKTAVGFMNLGYKKASKRFVNSFRANTQFRAIERVVDSAFQYELYEGQKFRLGWGKGEAVINEIYEEGY